MHCLRVVKLFTLALLIAFSGIILTGCGEDEAAKAEEAKKAEADAIIANAKKSAFPLDKSRTLEQVFNSNLKDVQWTLVEPILGPVKQLVTVTGFWNGETMSITKSEYTGLRRHGDLITVTTFCNPGNKITVKFAVKEGQTVAFNELKIESDKNDLGSKSHYEKTNFPGPDRTGNSLTYSDEKVLVLFK